MAPNADGLFPLKLVAFEHYMLVDDHADYPMVIRLELDFEGELVRDRISQALDMTQEENPLLRAKVQELDGQRYWVESAKTKIQWCDKLPEFIRLNLDQESGLKVFAKQDENVFSFRLFIHHSVADGSGINQFIERWLTHYKLLDQDAGQSQIEANPNSELTGTPPDPDFQQLRKRGWFGMNFFKYMLRPVQEFCGAIGILDYFLHRPVAIGPQQTDLPENPSESDPPSHRFITTRFSKEETKQLLGISKRLKYKVNDLMLTAMYDSFQQWLNEHQPDQANRCVRIMIPMDMRTRKVPEKFVGNKVSMIFVDRRPGRYRSLEHLCWYVWLEMTAVKMMKLSLAFFHLIRFYLIRGKLHKLLHRNRPIATTVLSNMGPVLNRTPLTDSDKGISMDRLRMTDYRVYPPVRPYTWFTSVVTTYRNQVSVNSTWCSRSLKASDVDQILARFKSNLLEGFASDAESKN